MEKVFTLLHESKYLRFVIYIVLLSLIPTILSVIVGSSIDSSSDKSITTLELIFVTLFLAPIFETLLFQFVPGLVIKRFNLIGFSRKAIIILPFLFVHFSRATPIPSLINGIGGAYVLGFCYLICMKKSHKHAFKTTALVHFLHNMIMLLSYYSYQSYNEY